MPLGEEYGGATYFMLETHYDNPAMHKDILDSSGNKLDYIKTLNGDQVSNNQYLIFSSFYYHMASTFSVIPPYFF